MPVLTIVQNGRLRPRPQPVKAKAELSCGFLCQKRNGLWQCRDGEKDQWGHTVTWVADKAQLDTDCPTEGAQADATDPNQLILYKSLSMLDSEIRALKADVTDSKATLENAQALFDEVQETHANVKKAKTITYGLSKMPKVKVVAAPVYKTLKGLERPLDKMKKTADRVEPKLQPMIDALTTVERYLSKGKTLSTALTDQLYHINMQHHPTKGAESKGEINLCGEAMEQLPTDAFRILAEGSDVLTGHMKASGSFKAPPADCDQVCAAQYTVRNVAAAVRNIGKFEQSSKDALSAVNAVAEPVNTLTKDLASVSDELDDLGVPLGVLEYMPDWRYTTPAGWTCLGGDWLGIWDCPDPVDDILGFVSRPLTDFIADEIGISDLHSKFNKLDDLASKIDRARQYTDTFREVRAKASRKEMLKKGLVAAVTDTAYASAKSAFEDECLNDSSHAKYDEAVENGFILKSEFAVRYLENMLQNIPEGGALKSRIAGAGYQPSEADRFKALLPDLKETCSTAYTLGEVDDCVMPILAENNLPGVQWMWKTIKSALQMKEGFNP